MSEGIIAHISPVSTGKWAAEEGSGEPWARETGLFLERDSADD
jgi:hypothetical protein